MIVPRQPVRRRGMTLTEAVVGMLILAIAIGGAMQATSVARLESVTADERAVARSLLSDAEAHLGALAYRDPQQAVTAIGREAGEADLGPSGWDDVDDADGWSGLPMHSPTLSDWVVDVTVSYANASTPASDSAAETGLKRVKLVARHGRRIILTQEVLRAAP